MSDRLRKLGLLTEHKQTLQALTYRAQGIIGSLGDATFVRSSPFHLDGDRVVSYARELQKVLAEGKALLAQIESLKEELGVE